MKFADYKYVVLNVIPMTRDTVLRDHTVIARNHRRCLSRAPASLVERTPERRAPFIEARNRLVKAIVDSGGKVIAGSDTPEWFHLHGFGLHRELAAFVEAQSKASWSVADG